MSSIDINSIYDFISLRKESYAYHFFYYNGLFPDDYEYEDMQYQPFLEAVPTYLNAFEFGGAQSNTSKQTRKMNVAFDLGEEEKEKYSVKLPGEVDDPVMKLSLKTMKPSTGIFLGGLKAGEDRDERYNVRIDFYKQGKKPILEVKV